MMRQYAEVTPLAERLAAQFLPGKLTVVLKPKNLPSELGTHTGEIGIRIPNHPIPLQIVRELGRPITATSANVSGMPQMHTVPEILAQFGDKAPLIIEVHDVGTLPPSLPSTVVDARGTEPIILREGAVSRDEIMTLQRIEL